MVCTTEMCTDCCTHSLDTVTQIDLLKFDKQLKEINNALTKHYMKSNTDAFLEAMGRIKTIRLSVYQHLTFIVVKDIHDYHVTVYHSRWC